MEKLLKTKKDREQFITWLAWLESDVFTQGRLWLQTTEFQHCCLGVACELFIPPHKMELKGEGRLDGALPEEQVCAPQWLKKLPGDFLKRKGYSITQLNDGTQLCTGLPEYPHIMHDFGRTDVKLSFKEIAKLLYETYKDELF